MKLQILTILAVLVPLLVVCLQSSQPTLSDKGDVKSNGDIVTIQGDVGEEVDGQKFFSSEIKSNGELVTIQGDVGEEVDGHQLLSSRETGRRSGKGLKNFGRSIKHAVKKTGHAVKHAVKKVGRRLKKWGNAIIDLFKAKETIKKWKKNCEVHGVLMDQDDEEAVQDSSRETGRRRRRRRAPPPQAPQDEQATCTDPDNCPDPLSEQCSCFSTALNACGGSLSQFEKYLTDKVEKCMADIACADPKVCDQWKDRSCSHTSFSLIGRAEARSNTLKANSTLDDSLDGSVTGKCTRST